MMTVKTVAMIVILLYNVRICQSKRYDNYTLYSTIPTDAEHLKFLQNLKVQKYIDIIFWKTPYKLFEDTQFIVSPKDNALFTERTNHFTLKTEVMLNNVGQAFDQQVIQPYMRTIIGSYDWRYYHSLSDIYLWLADLSAQYPDIDLLPIGKSIEGRTIFAVSITKPSNKYKVIVEGGIHGNEWIGVEFVTYLLHQLVLSKNDTKRGQLRHLARKYNWYLIPIVNPDGYVYSQEKDRLWRKNRRVAASGTGVDLNRNFMNAFGKYDASNNSNDDNYCGISPFSEPESKALADFIKRKRRNLKFYFSFHAYGQKLILPFSDRIKHLGNYGEMENFGKQAILSMYRMYGIKYSIGTTFDTLGVRLSGNSASWVKKHLGVRYVFTFLLRDNGTYGYALPRSQIVPTCKETLAGLIELMTAKPRQVKLNLFENRAQELKAVIFNLFYTVFVILLLK